MAFEATRDYADDSFLCKNPLILRTPCSRNENNVGHIMDEHYDLLALAQESSRRQRFNHIKTLALLVAGSFFVAYVTLETSKIYIAPPNSAPLGVVPSVMICASWWGYLSTRFVLYFRSFRYSVRTEYNYKDERVLESKYREERQEKYFMFVDFITVGSFVFSLISLYSFVNFASAILR